MDTIPTIPNNPINVFRANNSQSPKSKDFQETLKSFYDHVDRQLKEADQMVGEFAVGKRHDLHEIMIASEKAGISFNLLLQIRNKFLEAYQEIMRMHF